MKIKRDIYKRWKLVDYDIMDIEKDDVCKALWADIRGWILDSPDYEIRISRETVFSYL